MPLRGLGAPRGRLEHWGRGGRGGTSPIRQGQRPRRRRRPRRPRGPPSAAADGRTHVLVRRREPRARHAQRQDRIPRSTSWRLGRRVAGGSAQCRDRRPHAVPREERPIAPLRLGGRLRHGQHDRAGGCEPPIRPRDAPPQGRGAHGVAPAAPLARRGGLRPRSAQRHDRDPCRPPLPNRGSPQAHRPRNRRGASRGAFRRELLPARHQRARIPFSQRRPGVGVGEPLRVGPTPWPQGARAGQRRQELLDGLPVESPTPDDPARQARLGGGSAKTGPSCRTPATPPSRPNRCPPPASMAASTPSAAR